MKIEGMEAGRAVVQKALYHDLEAVMRATVAWADTIKQKDAEVISQDIKAFLDTMQEASLEEVGGELVSALEAYKELVERVLFAVTFTTLLTQATSTQGDE